MAHIRRVRAMPGAVRVCVSLLQPGLDGPGDKEALASIGRRDQAGQRGGWGAKVAPLSPVIACPNTKLRASQRLPDKCDEASDNKRLLQHHRRQQTALVQAHRRHSFTQIDADWNRKWDFTSRRWRYSTFSAGFCSSDRIDRRQTTIWAALIG